MRKEFRTLGIVVMLGLAAGCSKKDPTPVDTSEKAVAKADTAADAAPAAKAPPVAAEPAGTATLGPALRGIYNSDKEGGVNCGDGGAVLTLTSNHLYVESEDSTCTRVSGYASVKEDGPFTLVQLAGGDSMRFKTKGESLTVSGEDAGYISGSFTRDGKVEGAGEWEMKSLTELPATIQKEFKSCADVNCTDGATITLTGSSFYTESSDSTCDVSGSASNIAQDGPFTRMQVGGSEMVHVRLVEGGLRVGGPGSGYLEGHFKDEAAGGSCPAMPVAEEGGEEGEGEGEEEPSEEGDGSCEEYAECCSDYVDALADMAGMEGAAEAAEQSCSAISAMDELPGGSDACRQALDGMKQAMAAYRSMPGFSVPSSCQ